MNYKLENEKKNELATKETELEVMRSSIPEYLSIAFEKRTRLNKLFRVIYLIFRLAFVSVWFYFLPIIFLL